MVRCCIAVNPMALYWGVEGSEWGVWWRWRTKDGEEDPCDTGDERKGIYGCWFGPGWLLIGWREIWMQACSQL